MLNSTNLIQQLGGSNSISALKDGGFQNLPTINIKPGNIIPTFPGMPNINDNSITNSQSPMVQQLKEILANMKSRASEANENILSSVAVSSEIHEIAKTIYGNSIQETNPELWNSVLNSAVKANGGLGDQQKGFLSFSKEFGFVNTYNSNLSLEQNQVLAELSITKGIAVEDLPLAQSGDVLSNPSVQADIQNYMSQAQNPTQVNPEKKESGGFFGKVKQIFDIAKKGYDSLKGIGGDFSGILSKVSDFGGLLKNSGIGIVDKIGGFIGKGVSFLSNLF